MNRLRSRAENETNSSSEVSGMGQRWTNESCVTFQTWKNNFNKYVICVIKVAKRGKYYYSTQPEPHFTYHWLQPEHWAAFESKLNDLTAGSTLKYLTRTLRYKLIDSIQLSISRSTIPIDLLCETISSDSTVRKKDVIAAIECKFEYFEEDKCPEDLSPFKELQRNCKAKKETQGKTPGKKNLSKYQEEEKNMENCSEELSPFKELRSTYKDKEETQWKTPGKKNLSKYQEEEKNMENCSEEFSPFKDLQSTYKDKEENHGKTPGKKQIRNHRQQEKKLVTLPKEDSGKYDTERNLRRRDNTARPQATDQELVDSFSPLKGSSDQQLTIKNDGDDSQDFLTPEKAQLRSDRESSQKKQIDTRKQQDQKKIIFKLDGSDDDLDDPLEVLAPTKPLQNKTSIISKSQQKRHKRDQSDSNSEREESKKSGKRKKYTEISPTSSDFSEDSCEENNLAKALSVLSGNSKELKKSSPSNKEKSIENLAKKYEKVPILDKPKGTKFTLPKPILVSPATTASRKKQKKKADIKSPAAQCHSMNKWLSKKNEEKPKENTNQDEVNLIASDSDFETIRNSDSQNSSQEKDSTQINKINDAKQYTREVSKFLQELVPKIPTKVENLDLMKLESDEILSTLDLYHPKLQSLFEEFKWKSKPKHKNGVDHYLVMSLLTQAKQLIMMNALSERYEKHQGGLPKYGELFSMVLMPEWILCIFMQRYNMTRQQAIDHIKAQNAYKMYLQSEVQIDESIMM